MRSTAWLLAGIGCTGSPADRARPAPSYDEATVATVHSGDVTVRDIALATGFQGIVDGQLQHGRALVAADFDLDGRIDFYFGNPGDTSYVARSVAGPDGLPRYELVQVLEKSLLAWGAAPLDYDNDGDLDLFITNGGNEGIGYNALFRNEMVETGELSFTDVTDEAGIAGPMGRDGPLRVANGNAAVIDYDRDGDDDVFVSVDIVTTDSYSVDACSGLAGDPTADELKGRNELWQNQGDGTFVDVTDAAGLGDSRFGARNSSWLDIDGDGDHDLFLNNTVAANQVFLNQLVETGISDFVVGNDQFAALGADFSYPISSPAVAPDDFDQDGRTDVLVFNKSNADLDGDNPYGEGHALFVASDAGWENEARGSGILTRFEDLNPGVMGCQVGDVNLDGRPDVYVGNGGTDSGTVDALFLSTGEPGDPVSFVPSGELTDFEAPKLSGVYYPPYPYRTHGTVIVDVDGDGLPEIAVQQGGPAVELGAAEPNRLFKFDFGVAPPPVVRIRLVGDGLTVPRDAIGSRVHIRTSGPAARDFYQTIAVGRGFSAHVLDDLDFALPGAEGIESVAVRWTDGTEETFEDPIPLGARAVITLGGGVVVDPAPGT